MSLEIEEDFDNPLKQSLKNDIASPKPDAIREIIRERLQRRLSAPRRIGCPYRLASFTAAPGFDASSWLPGEVMARFFALP